MRPSIRQRLAYRLLLVEHVLAMASLRLLRPRRVAATRGDAAATRRDAAATRRDAAAKNADGPLRIAILSPHPPEHIGTVARFTRWIPYLERQGHEVEILTPSTDKEFDDYKNRIPGADVHYHHVVLWNQWRNIRRAAKADVVVLHRGLFPFSPWQRPSFERLLARLNPHLVYDFYDAIWVERQQASRQSGRILRWLHPADKIEQIVAMSKVVTVSNEGLAEFARRTGKDVRIVPMLLEPGDYEVHAHEKKSPVVLGWLGSRFNLPRLRSLEPALQRVAKNKDILLRVVSAEPVEMSGVPVESLTHPWSPETESSDLASLDVGLLPLDDSEHDRDKSPFKLLQYMAAGLAVIGTPTAIDLEVVKPGESFLPAESEDDWVDAMTRLVDDARLRARLGACARETVVAHYSFESCAQKFVDALRAAAR